MGIDKCQLIFKKIFHHNELLSYKLVFFYELCVQTIVESLRGTPAQVYPMYVLG